MPAILSQSNSTFNRPISSYSAVFSRAGAGLPPTVHEQLGQLVERRFPPLGDLDRMDLELRIELTERVVAAHRLDRHPCFELRTVRLTCRRHQPLLANDPSES